MFIKMVKFTEEGLEDYESIYHCVGSILTTLPQGEECKELNLKLDFGGGKEEDFSFGCKNISIFYMNDNGKTIDRKEW